MRGAVVGCVFAVAFVTAAACVESHPGNQAPGNTVVNDTHNSDAQPPPPPPPPPDDGGTDGISYDGYGYSDGAPMVNPCDMCTCDMTTSYCWAGVGRYMGATGGGAEAGYPACPLVDAGAATTTTPGCTMLPPECAAMPTCACVINSIQTAIFAQYHCYLDCTPDPGYLLVYCP